MSCRGRYLNTLQPPRVERMAACRYCGAATVTRGYTAPVCIACRTRPCEQCGQTFQRAKAQRFCSKVCAARWRGDNLDWPIGPASPTWRGVARPYATHEWFQVRDRVRERDGWRCVDCGKARPEVKRLMAHHLVSRDDWGSRPGHADDDANLVTVCHTCHLRRHAASPEVLAARERERHRAYYLAHKDKALAQSRAWALANPEGSREIKRRSAARRRAATATSPLP